MSGPRISGCLVVKNEQLFLRECLASLASVVDELIVVDTGSGDRTVSIARDMGATVFEEPWPGDLARAHDLPVQRASGDWILMLDGDEALDFERGPEIRDLVRQTTHDGFRCTVLNYRFHPGLAHRASLATDPMTHGACSWSPSVAIRLFRNCPTFRHEGRVHQSLLDSMMRAGASVSSTSIPIHHYGFLRTDRAKSPLYSLLAQQQVEDRPQDSKSALELGIVYLDARRFDAALACFTRSHELGNVVESRFFCGLVRAEMGQPEEALEALLDASNAARELRYFVDEADIWQLLGQTYAELGDASSAEDAFRAALRLRPDCPESEGRLAAVLAARGSFEEAAVLAGRLIERYPGLPVSWEASGYRALIAGFPDAAISDFRRALDIDPERLSSKFNLAIAHARAGEAVRAQTVLKRAAETDRENRLPRHAALVAGSADPPELPGPLGSPGVLSFIPYLCGGAALVACELVRALAPHYHQAVATLDAGHFTGEDHHRSLAALGVPVITVKDAEAMARVQAKAAPQLVIHHWWQNDVLQTLQRVGAERLVLRSASPLSMPEGYDHYVTLSGFQEQYQGHIPSERRERIPNGVDLDRFGGAQPDERFWSGFGATGERPVRIVMLSRLDPDKFLRRLPHWLQGLNDLPINVAIGGRGARRWEIEPELVACGLAGRVRFLGPIPQHEVAGFLAAADIGLHLTETHQESHSLTVLQMMATGLPIVAQPRGCLPEMILEGKTGYLADSETGAVAALRRLVSDQALRLQLGDAARSRVQRYDIRVFSERWRDLVARLCAAA